MHIVAFGLKLQLWKKNKHIWAHLCSLNSNFTATHTQTLVRPAAETVCARCHGRSLTRGFLIKLPFPCYFWGKSFHTRMQNISLLALQNNCLVTSQIRLSWKIKLLLLISHRPHAHMQHSCKYWKSAALQAWGDLWAQLSCLAANLLLCTEGFRANPTTPRCPSSCSRALPGLLHPEMSIQGHCVGSAPPGLGHSQWSVAPLDLELSCSRCLRAGRLLGESPAAAATRAIMLWVNCLVLVSFSSASIRLVNVQQNIFFFFFYISEAIILLLPRLPNKITYLESILLHAQNLQGTA